MRRMRTNAGTIIMGSVPRNGQHVPQRLHETGNVILDYARDAYCGDMSEWATELLWATQILRLAYDSPRIGGGIDPAVASGVEALEPWGRLNNYIVGSLTGSQDSPWNGRSTHDPDHMGALEGMSPERVQDMIVHAETVALLTLAVYGEIG